MAILLQAAPGALMAVLSVSAIVIPLVIVINLLFRLTSRASLPSDLPWAGIDGSGSSWTRLKANLTSILNLKGLTNEGYAKVRHP
jgi:hypothetical protein